MNREDLIAFIEEAFDGVEQPVNITLHVAQAHDDYDYDNWAIHAKKDFRGRWQDVPERHLALCQNSLSYLDETGLPFYLPAFMTWVLKSYGKNPMVITKELELPDWCDVIYSMDHPLYTLCNFSPTEEYSRKRFSLFTPDQMKACAKYVLLWSDYEFGGRYSAETRKYYDRCWKHYDI